MRQNSGADIKIAAAEQLAKQDLAAHKALAATDVELADESKALTAKIASAKKAATEALNAHVALAATDAELTAESKKLSAEIAKKQRERHELRRKAQEEQKRLDDAAATEEVLMYERDRYAKLEQQTAMALALTKQEAKKRATSK